MTTYRTTALALTLLALGHCACNYQSLSTDSQQAGGARLLQTAGVKTPGANAALGQQLFGLVNQFRGKYAAQGVVQLAWNPTAYQMAVNQNAYMLANNNVADDRASYSAAGFSYYVESTLAFNRGDDSTAASIFMSTYLSTAAGGNRLLAGGVDQGAAAISYQASNNRYVVTVIFVKQAAASNPPVVVQPGDPDLPPGTYPIVTAPVPSEGNVSGLNVEVANQLFALVDQYRASNNVAALVYNATAYSQAAAQTTARAQGNSAAIATRNQRIAQWPKGYTEAYSGLTRQLDADVAQKFFDTWLNSVSYKQFMLTSYLKQGAIAVYYDSAADAHWVDFLIVNA